MNEWTLSEGKTTFGTIKFVENDRVVLTDLGGKEYRAKWRIEKHILQFNQRQDDIWTDIDISEDGSEISLFYRDDQGKGDGVVKYKRSL